jgi:hypothetical protein
MKQSAPSQPSPKGRKNVIARHGVPKQSPAPSEKGPGVRPLAEVRNRIAEISFSISEVRNRIAEINFSISEVINKLIITLNT